MHAPHRLSSLAAALACLASFASSCDAWSAPQAPAARPPAPPAPGAAAPPRMLNEEDISVLVDDEDVQSQMQALIERVRNGIGADGGSVFTRIQELDLRSRQAPEIEKGAAFFGVATEPVSPQTAAQLPVPRGSGLVVSFVEPESPAAKAGLAPFDVLARLGDQVLVNAEQFAVLVRARKAGEAVEVTYLRGGKEQQAHVTLAARDLPRLGPGGRHEAGVDAAGFAAPGHFQTRVGMAGPPDSQQRRVIVMNRSASRPGDPMVRSERREVRTMTFKDEHCGISWVMDGPKPSFVVRDASKDGMVAWEGSGPPSAEDLAALRPEVADAVRRFVAEQDRLREAIPNAPVPPMPTPTPAGPAPGAASAGRAVD